MLESVDIYVDGRYIGQAKEVKITPNTFEKNEFFSAEKINGTIRINFSREQIQQLIEVIEKFIYNIKAWVKALVNSEVFQKLLKAVNHAEIKKHISAIEKRNKSRKNWRQDSYRNRFNSRTSDKRMICHNCRNNC